jgi:sulfate/thiosulfate transport system substrate-binding protein
MILKRRLLLNRAADLLPIVLLSILFIYALWPWLPTPGRAARPRTIAFYGFSILGEVMNTRVFPAFEAEWEARTGERAQFVSAFASSGTVANQVTMGVPAEFALLSLESDADKIAKAGVVPDGSWRKLPYQGVVNRTPFVILTRPGNPKGIRDFADCAKPGVKIVHPDPLTSGGANWALLAEYGAGARRSGGSPEAGREMLLGIWRNVVAQAASARATRTQFENGFGDVLITYEQETLFDKARGKLKGEIVYPRSTILSEHTLVIVDRNISPEERRIVDAFAEFLWSEKGQRLFVESGFRSVNEELNAHNPVFGKIADPFLVKDFGGWPKAKKEIVEKVWKEQVLKQLGK